MGHYSINGVKEEDGMGTIRDYFKSIQDVNELNLIFFSTSGVHGSYTLIEEIEADPVEDECEKNLTFLIVQPRLVSLTYGLCLPKTKEDFKFLKALREETWRQVVNIGRSNVEHTILGI